MQNNLENNQSPIKKNLTLKKGVSSIAHDIQTPLAILQMLLIPISKNIPEQQYKLLEDAIQDLREITNRLDDYYRCDDNANS